MFALVSSDGETHLLNGAGPWVVGRHSSADVQCSEDPYCARRQFELRREGKGLLIAPLSSSSDTFLSGKPLKGQMPAPIGAEISFGKSKFRVALTSSGASGGAGSGVSSGARSRTGASPAPLPPHNGAIVIGREPGPGGIGVEHPTVSRKHARFEPSSGGGGEVRDLGSTNGTYVNGKRITGAARVKDGDEVRIGLSRFVVSGSHLRLAVAKGGDTAIAAQGVAIDVRNKGEQLRILHPCSLKIRSGEFVALVGGSGAGKSTLMNALSGRMPVSEGVVEIEGADLNREFDALKQFMSFVPQREVLHETLTVRAALGFIAELRLPSDMPASERVAAIDRAAADVELSERLDTPFRSLSGGQKKRACLAAEILCRPRILFLDEVTSGLDEQTDFEIMRLLARLAEGGTTVVCVTHTLSNIARFCDRVVVMAKGGHLAFNGAPSDGLAFFGVERLGDVFPLLTDRTAADWAARFRREVARSDSEQSSARSKPRPAANGEGPLHKVMQRLNQFGVLIRRNLALLAADRGTLALTFGQALIIGVFVGWALSDYGEKLVAISSRKTLLTLLVMSAMWMGCSGASKDIVAEATILQREKDVNLSLSAYLLAKLFTASIFAAAQVTLMFGLVMALSGGIPGDLLTQFLLLNATAFVGVTIGLLISASSASETQAAAIVPVALIPQLIFIGSLVPQMPELLADLSAALVPSNTLHEAMLAVYVRDDGPINEFSLKTGRQALLTARPLADSVGLVSVHYLLFMVATYIVLRIRYRSGASR